MGNAFLQCGIVCYFQMFLFLCVCVCEVSVYLPEFLDREQRATLLHWGRVEDEAASGCPGCAQPVYACRVVVRDDFKRINP